MNEGTVIHESPPQREPIDSVNSPALKVRIALGRFDTNPIGENLQLPATVDQKSLDALHNQNVRQREEDAKKFAAAYQNPDHPLSPETLRHNQMQAWSLGIWKEMNDLVDAKQEKVLAIFADPQKLGIPIKPNGNDLQELLKQFYDQSTQKEGSFYQKFCTGNMSANLAKALTVDDMMHLKTFLTKWMLGSEQAFDALVMLRRTQDDLKDSAQRATLKDEPLTDRDESILAYYQAGLNMGKSAEDDDKERLEENA